MVDNISFSEWLSNEMEERGYSQSELAREAGVSRAVIHKVINQLSNRPDPETCVAIARALDLSPVTVFRAAGLLPPQTEIDEWEDFRSILERLSDKGRKELLAMAKVKLSFENE